MRRGTGRDAGWGLAAAGLLGAYLAHNVEMITGLAAWIAELPISVVLRARQLDLAITFLTLGTALVLLGTRARP